MLTVLSFLAVLMVVILVHELGHFVTAKLSGVRVEEFGLFYPPRLLSFKRGDTVYSLNALPLGGFVKMSGEEDPNAPGSLASKSVPRRLMVLGAGSLMNLLLPLVLLTIAFMIPHDEVVGEVSVIEVAVDSPAEAVGMVPGDVLVSIDGQTINNIGDLQRILYVNLGGQVDILVRHVDASEDVFRLTPRWKPPEGQGTTGATVTSLDAVLIQQQYSFFEAIPLAGSRSIELFVLFKNGIVGMISGALPVDLRGPVGIAEMTGEAARAGIAPLLELASLISINLGLINLFPIPALDGGRVAFVLIEFFRRGKRISPKKEWIIHTAGFALLLGFLLVVTFGDIMRIAGGG